MSKGTDFTIRLSKAMREFNVGRDTIIEFLAKKGFQVNPAPNTKLTAEMYALLVKEFQGEKDVKNEAKRLGNISYKGGSVSIESNSYTSAVANPEEIKEIEKHRKQKEKERKLKKEERFAKQKEKRKEKKEKTIETKIELKIPFSELEFGHGLVSLTYNGKQYVYINSNILNYGVSLENIYSRVHETVKDRIKAFFIRVIIDVETGSFTFQDIDICKYVKSIIDGYSFLPKNKKPKYSNEILSKTNEKKEERKRTINAKIEYRVPFSKLKFNQGFASITYKNKCYIYRDDDIKDYDRILNQIYSRISKTSKSVKKAAAIKNRIRNFLIWVVIDTEKETFTFKEIDIHKKYFNSLKAVFLPEKNEFEPLKEIPSQNKTEPQKPSLVSKTMTLGADNIRFFNGYYLIFQTTNGEIDSSIAPYRVNDPNSNEILNLVHKYFEQILEQKRILVKYNETKILEPSSLELFQLGNYVRELKRNLDEKDVWWEEVQNARKRSFGQCFGESTESVKKRVVRSKNEFLYNLSSLQNEKKLIRVYEINHGKEEDAFIFTISMSNNRCAIVFENASKDASTTTWIFVAKNEDYEPCINLVFDYFTDYTITLKRSSLRSTINPPEKFKAESYAFIYHDDIGQWLKKLNKIIGQTPEPSEIQFVPGLHIPESSDTRSGHGETISTRHLHNQLMSKLYDKLCSESGKDNVGTEIRVGTKRIDTVVKGNDFYDIYEIKTAENPFECVTEALGQLCQYTYLFCRDKIGKMVIVGPSEMTKEVKEYLSWFRKNYSLQLYSLVSRKNWDG